MIDKYVSINLGKSLIFVKLRSKNPADIIRKVSQIQRLNLKWHSQPSDYINDYQVSLYTSNVPALPSLLVHDNFSLEKDINYILRDFSIWEIVKLFVNRPSAHRQLILDKISVLDGHNYEKSVTPFLSCRYPIEDPYFYVINCVLRSGPEQDVFLLGYTYTTYLCRDVLPRELLCVKSFEQIQEIKAMFHKMRGVTLQEFLTSKMKGSLLKFFLEILQTPRSTSRDFNPNDPDLCNFQLYTNDHYFKANKHLLIDIFTKRSFYEIRAMCQQFQRTHTISILKTFKGSAKSRLKKCAKTLCEYSMNPYQYFAKLIRRNILVRDHYGVLRLITSRSEIDLMNILREYRNRYSFSFPSSIKGLFDDYMSIYRDVVIPLCGFELANNI